MSIFSDIGNVVSGVAHSVENVVGAGVHAAEEGVCTAVKAGEGAVEGAIGDVLKNPLDIFNPFGVIKGAINGALHNIEGNCSSGSTNPFDPSSSASTSGGSSVADLGGGSIEAVLLQLASKERSALADKVGQLKNLQVPGKDATPQQQADYDSTKTELMADIQALQNSIQQITTMATNVQKNDNDTNMSVIRNIGG